MESSQTNDIGNARPAPMATPSESYAASHAAGHTASVFGLPPGPVWQTLHQPPQPSTPVVPSAAPPALTPTPVPAATWNASLPTTPPYVPQFSAATSLILSRMKRDRDFSSALSDASAAVSRPDKLAFEDAKTRLVQQMSTTSSTLPAPQPSNLVRQPSLEEIMQKGIKRKRDDQGGREGEDADKKSIDFTQNTIVLPIQTPPQPRNQLPGKATTATGAGGMCVKCGMSSSLPSNLLIVCTRCNIVCHQGCFPASSMTADMDSGPTDICPQCINATEGQIQSQTLPPHLQPEDVRRKQKIERIRQMRLAALPEGIHPAKPELVGFAPGAASDRAVSFNLFLSSSGLSLSPTLNLLGKQTDTLSQRTEYFSNMKKTDALNLLSFCDQLRPQLLVDVMVSISKRHPDLPMFNSPDWDKTSARHSASSKSLAAQRKAAAGRPPHGRSLLNSKAKQKIKSSTIAKNPSVKRLQKRSQLAEEMVAEPLEEVEDGPPPKWPKPGEGLYMKLVPEVDDRVFLADENDEEAFSHFMVDKLGRQIIDPV